MELFLMLALGLVSGMLVGIRLGREVLYYTPSSHYFRAAFGITRWQAVRLALRERARWDMAGPSFVMRWYYTLKAVLAILLGRDRPLWREDHVVVAQFDFEQHSPMGDGRYWDSSDLTVAKRGLAFDIEYNYGDF